MTTTQDMAFLIFDASANGNLRYTASGTLVATSTIEVSFTESSAGNFSVQLGGSGTNEIASEIFANNAALYLEVWVEGTKLTPRRRLTSVPYAINSQYLLGISASSTSSTLYIPHSDSHGNFLFTGNPQSALPGGGIIYVNPTSTDADETLFALAVNGNQRFRVDEDGDTEIQGTLSVSSTLTVNPSTGYVGINSSSPNYGLAVSGTSFFAGTSTVSDLLRVDGKIRNPLVLSTILPSSETVYDVRVVGDYAYLAGGAGGTYIYDISEPRSPVLVKRIDTPSGNVEVLEVAGDYVYAGTSGTNLQMIDISRPAQAFVAGSINLGGAVTDIKVVGNTAYVAAGGDLKLVDFSEPVKPVVISAYFFGNIASIDVSGHYVYGGDTGLSKLRVINIADPLNPFEVTNVSTDGIPTHVLISGKFLYLSDNGGDELAIFDISDPYNPTQIASFDPGGAGSAYGKAISGNFLYLAFSVSGMHIIDISNNASPVLVKTVSPVAGTGLRVDVAGNYVYFANSSGGLHIIDVSGAEIAHATIGTLGSNNFHVRNRAIFDGNVLARGGVNIGYGGLQINGGLSMLMSTSTINATNTLQFSHAAVFESSVTSTYSNAFVFNTRHTLSIATTTYLLSVRNNDARVFSVSSNGDVITTGTYYGLGGAFGTPGSPGDLAEQVDIAIDDSVEAGDVIIVDPNTPDTYRRSQGAYERAVAGVISTNPTITIGYGKTQHTALLAMVGRVPIKVTAENGPIVRGDLLVSASKPGYAMRYDPTKDDGVKVVGIIGVALDPLTGEEGKILSLVKSGWINNRNATLSEIQQDLIELAEVDGVDINTDPETLSIEENFGGGIDLISENLNLNGYYIVNVAGIYGKSNKWQIDEEGRFITRVKTSEGDKALYALQSEKTEYVFSGSGVLQNGVAEIIFPTSTREILDTDKQINVSVTLTSEANGVYITNKSTSGFTVKELLAGVSNATFDWVVIAERKLGEIVDGVKVPVEEPLIGNNENPGDVLPQDPINPEPVVPPGVDPIEDINDPIEENPPVEVLPEPVVPEADPPAEAPPEVPVDAAPAPEPVEVAPEPVPEAPAPDPAL